MWRHEHGEDYHSDVYDRQSDYHRDLEDAIPKKKKEKEEKDKPKKKKGWFK